MERKRGAGLAPGRAAEPRQGHPAGTLVQMWGVAAHKGERSTAHPPGARLARGAAHMPLPKMGVAGDEELSLF